MNPTPPDAVLLMGFGSPRSRDEMEEFLRRVTGRAVSAELAERTWKRYEAISGSPFREISWRQAAGLEELLSRRGRKLKVSLGFLHSAPFISEAIQELLRGNPGRIIGVPLTPFSVSLSVGAYRRAAEAALADCGRGVEWKMVSSYHEEPRFLAAVTEKLAAVFAENPTLSRARAPVLFSAHSVPRTVPDQEQYVRQLEFCQREISERLGLEQSALGFQSAGRGGEWLKPSGEELAQTWAREGKTELVVCPLGFVSDHVETLYDLDIELKQQVESMGMRYYRAASLNDSPAFLQALAAVVED